MSARRDHNWRGYLFVAPAAVYLAIFTLLPIAAAAYMSLHRWHLLKPQRPFVGWGNFATLLGDPFFREAIVNTLVFVAISVPLGVASALAVALLVSRPLRGVGFFRTLFYTPSVCSQVALSMLWIWILMPAAGAHEGGLLAFLLGRLGFPVTRNVLADPWGAMLALAALMAWIGVGPRMIIFVAGLQSIPHELHEAAALDGAGPWQKVRHVTLPLLLPTALFVFVTTTIAAFQFFTPVYVITRGGPRRSTDVLMYHIYREAWQKFEAGMASAQSFVLFALILIAALLQLRLMRRGLHVGDVA